MSAFPEFRHAVVSWRTVAIRRLRKHTTDWTRQAGRPVWRQYSDGMFRMEREPLVWDSDPVHQLTLLPQWSRIEQAVSNNSKLRKHFGTIVGSDYARAQIDLEGIMTYLLPRPIRSDDRNDVLLDDSRFEGSYHRLEDFCPGIRSLSYQCGRCGE
jgi:hypothetical protein